MWQIQIYEQIDLTCEQTDLTYEKTDLTSETNFDESIEFPFRYRVLEEKCLKSGCYKGQNWRIQSSKVYFKTCITSLYCKYV